MGAAAGGAVGVMAAGAGFVVLTKRRKKEEEEEAARHHEAYRQENMASEGEGGGGPGGTQDSAAAAADAAAAAGAAASTSTPSIRGVKWTEDTVDVDGTRGGGGLTPRLKSLAEGGEEWMVRRNSWVGTEVIELRRGSGVSQSGVSQSGLPPPRTVLVSQGGSQGGGGGDGKRDPKRSLSRNQIVDSTSIAYNHHDPPDEAEAGSPLPKGGASASNKGGAAVLERLYHSEGDWSLMVPLPLGMPRGQGGIGGERKGSAGNNAVTVSSPRVSALGGSPSADKPLSRESSATSNTRFSEKWGEGVLAATTQSQKPQPMLRSQPALASSFQEVNDQDLPTTTAGDDEGAWSAAVTGGRMGYAELAGRGEGKKKLGKKDRVKALLEGDWDDEAASDSATSSSAVEKKKGKVARRKTDSGLPTGLPYSSTFATSDSSASKKKTSDPMGAALQRQRRSLGGDKLLSVEGGAAAGRGAEGLEAWQAAASPKPRPASPAAALAVASMVGAYGSSPSKAAVSGSNKKNNKDKPRQKNKEPPRGGETLRDPSPSPGDDFDEGTTSTLNLNPKLPERTLRGDEEGHGRGRGGQQGGGSDLQARPMSRPSPLSKAS